MKLSLKVQRTVKQNGPNKHWGSWKNKKKKRSGGADEVYFALESNHIKSMLYKNSDGFNEF